MVPRARNGRYGGLGTRTARVPGRWVRWIGWIRVRDAERDLCGVDHLRHAQGYPLNPSSEPDPVRRSSRCDGGCRRAMRAPTVGIKRARYATPSTVAPAWSAKRCENARHQDSLRIAQALRRATQSALPVLHTALSGRDSGS